MESAPKLSQKLAATLSEDKKLRIIETSREEEEESLVLKLLFFKSFLFSSFSRFSKYKMIRLPFAEAQPEGGRRESIGDSSVTSPSSGSSSCRASLSSSDEENGGDGESSSAKNAMAGAFNNFASGFSSNILRVTNSPNNLAAILGRISLRDGSCSQSISKTNKILESRESQTLTIETHEQRQIRLRDEVQRKLQSVTGRNGQLRFTRLFYKDKPGYQPWKTLKEKGREGGGFKSRPGGTLMNRKRKVFNQVPPKRKLIDQPLSRSWAFHDNVPKVPQPKSEEEVTDEFELLQKYKELDSCWNVPNTAPDSPNPEETFWRHGPAKFWYDKSQIPLDTRSKDYWATLKEQARLNPITVSESETEAAVAAIVNQLNAEDELRQKLEAEKPE